MKQFEFITATHVEYIKAVEIVNNEIRKKYAGKNVSILQQCNATQLIQIPSGTNLQFPQGGQAMIHCVTVIMIDNENEIPVPDVVNGKVINNNVFKKLEE